MKEDKKRNTTMGWSFSIGGLLLLLCAGLLSIEIFARQSDPGIERYIEACNESAMRLGLSPRQVSVPTKGTLMLSGDTESPVHYIGQLNALIGFCPMHELNSMCAGAGCAGVEGDVRHVSPTFSAILALRSDTPERGFFVKSK